jgi:hypothetical protein
VRCYGKISNDFEGEEDLFGGGEYNDPTTGRSCTSRATQTVDVLVAIGRETYLKNKCYTARTT